MALDDAVERTKEKKRIRRDDDDDDSDEDDDDIDDESSYYSSWRTPRRIGNSIDCLIMSCAIRLGPDPFHTSIMQQFEEESEMGANSFQVPTGVPTLRPREWFAAHGKSSGNSSAFMSIMNESLMSINKCSSSRSLVEDFDTHLVSENNTSNSTNTNIDTLSAQRAQSLPGHESQARCDGLIIQQFEEATTSGNNLVPPEVNLVEEAIEFASNINPENLPIRSYDANGALIDVQWQGEVNALETFHDDPTFRNVVSQQDSILHSVLTTSISKLSTSSFKNLGIISVPTNASVANEEMAVLPREWFAAHGKSTGNSSNFNMSFMNESLMSFSSFQSIEPSENDILFGRGGHTNRNPGNICFREKALELRPVYEACDSKEEKYRISQDLVDCMKAENRRFLKIESDGQWYEMVGNNVRKKASQQLRERARRGGGL